MEKATYSLSALKQCKELIRKNRWSTRLKAEHNSRCAEVNRILPEAAQLCHVLAGPFPCLRLSADGPFEELYKKTTRQSVSCLPRVQSASKL